MEISMLIYSNQINLYDVLITVHNMYYVELLLRSFFFRCLLFLCDTTDLLARISTLERENVELKKKIKPFEEIFQIVIGKENFRKNNWAF